MRVRPLVGLIALLVAFLLVVPGSVATASSSTAADSSGVGGGPEVPDRAASESGEPSCPAAAGRSADGSPSIGDATEPTEPRIVELHPNPVARGNVGEFFVVEIPAAAATENWTVTDGHATASLPADLDHGRVAVSLEPAETRGLTSHPVVELEGHLRLAEDGDALALANDSGVVDAVAYDRAPEGEIWYRSDEAVTRQVGEEASGKLEDERVAAAGGEWWPREATCLPVTTHSPDDVTAFVLPDAPEVALETIAAADDRILVGGYTFTDEGVAAELARAAERGVEVKVLLEAGPVGGTPEETGPVLDELADAGVSIRVLGGDGARYAFHHPKYAVVDDRVLVTTENWKPSGVGGASSRGWGVVVDDRALASELAAVFEADAAGHDTTSWEAHRERVSFVEEDEATGEFAGNADPESVAVDRVELLLAPDNAEDRLAELLASAEEEILVEQVRIGAPDFPLLEAVLEAARGGVRVRILLDGSWYVADENRELAERIEATADREGLPVEVRVADPSADFEKVHAKGVIVDGETAVVGSPNWNEHAFRENREVALVLHGEGAAAYYAAVFESDWEGDGGSRPLPVELVAVALLALGLSALAGRRYVGFAPEGSPAPTGLPSRTDRPVRPVRPVTIAAERPAREDSGGTGDEGTARTAGEEVDRSADPG